MSIRKTRPTRGTPIAPGMSQRDIAACLATTTAWINQCKAVAATPVAEFDALLDEKRTPPVVAELARIGRARRDGVAVRPVPVRGRVYRALELYNGMTDAERADFISRIGVTT